jgi:hypothetical protein
MTTPAAPTPPFATIAAPLFALMLPWWRRRHRCLPALAGAPQPG